jgi:hypothetical protein
MTHLQDVRCNGNKSWNAYVVPRGLNGKVRYLQRWRIVDQYIVYNWLLVLLGAWGFGNNFSIIIDEILSFSRIMKEEYCTEEGRASWSAVIFTIAGNWFLSISQMWDLIHGVRYVVGPVWTKIFEVLLYSLPFSYQQLSQFVTRHGPFYFARRDGCRQPSSVQF